ncbi:MAG: class I SAM-dependent methyltransferase [Dehalococcoidia bacterium]|nr:MAG: class I SAM-dependent methyltransferase [Dehalococcoidia bacterium]
MEPSKEAFFTNELQNLCHLDAHSYESAAILYHQIYCNLLPRDKQAKVLDIGCGGGHFLYYLHREGYTNFLGIDISPYIVNFVKNNICERIEQADIFQFLKTKKNEYDIIVGNELVEHIPKGQIINMLELIHSALKSGGRVILKTPNMGAPFAIYARYLDFTHSIGFTEYSLAEILTVAGFQQVAIFPASRRFSLIRNYFTLRMCIHLPGYFLYEIPRFAFEKVMQYLYHISDRSPGKLLSKSIIGTGTKLVDYEGEESI